MTFWQEKEIDLFVQVNNVHSMNLPQDSFLPSNLFGSHEKFEYASSKLDLR